MGDIEIYSAMQVKMRNVYAMLTNLGVVLVDFNNGIYRVITSMKVNRVPYQDYFSQAVTSDGKYFIQNVSLPDPK